MRAHHFCKNHSEQKTNKKCHYCQGYICTACQIPFLATVFCSRSCLLLALLRDIWRSLLNPSKRRDRKIAAKKAPAKKYMPCLLHLFYLILFVLIWHQFREMREEIRQLHQLISQPVTVKRDTVFIKAPAEPIKTPEEISPEVKKPEAMEMHPAVPAVDFSRGRIENRTMALTFDGGSGDGAAAEILDYLKTKHVQCTFFLTGKFIRKFPDIVRRIVADGHEVGNHTWSHPHLTSFEKNHRHDTLPTITREKLHQELNKTAALFKQTTGREMARLWRAPYGEHNAQIRSWAAELGYVHVGWTLGRGETLDTFDWVADPGHKLYQPSQQILHNILHFGANRPEKANGGIILMHLDSQRRQDPPHSIVPALIDSIRHRGYELVTVSQMVGG